jgi:hypothetical protein
MKVLVLHSRHTERGGEDLAVESEEELPANQGHTVLHYRRDNAEIEQFTIVQKAVLPGTTIRSNKSFAEVRRLALRHQPEVGGLTEADGRTLKPPSTAETENWLVGARMVSCISDQESTWSCELSRPGYRGWVVWNPDGIQNSPGMAGKSAERVVGRTRALFYRRDWRELTLHLLQRTLSRGGVFHLWGYSWEIEQKRQWKRLEELRVMAANKCRLTVVTNSELGSYVG